MSANINFLIKKIKKNKFKSSRISYTSFLIKKGTFFCLKKLNEEFLELKKELLLNNKKKIIYETADLIYHLLVLLEKKKVNFFDVIKELKRRQKISGLVEKNNRKKNVR
jgi:phosphoribosyl-ATP pyrophosphohydrolase